MKKFLSILLVLVLVASLFTGCDLFGGGEKETEAETQAPKATLEKAVEFLVTTYKGSEGKETSNNYELIPQITIDGVSYAASMNGMPHGTGSITTNNFDGHHCIHFLNSRTHTGNRWDTAHQAAVQKAYKAGQ